MINVRALRERAVYVGRRNMYGETESNNNGPFIVSMGGRPGNEWCALYAGYCWRRAYQLEGLGDPKWCYRRPGVPEVGARALCKAMARLPAAIKFTDPALALPGDLVLWKRRRAALAWQRHVGLVATVTPERGLITALEGNVGRFPARVVEFTHAVEREAHFETFVGVR